ncbi:AAA family ATPase [Lachnotalea sp. AF33-28]|jgi:predicted ATPase|uniref:AAA family ATPase n=1 Tax=Lachnotalea sp. AF33-28 TaxID=2292046 RepID=UPI000E552FFD|nr:AAA family ATPase [Lachnotalea sp. AF33-28]RHP34386.1 ATP-binding cassette domain-containing protein [Lachnotalea sp. AF33-28]
MFLNQFVFPDAEQEFDFFMSVQRRCYDSYYPFQVLTKIGFERIDFEPVTILYGGNGCGKSTVLNVIAEKLKLERGAPYNKSSFFQRYVDLCGYETDEEVTEGSRIITSDDVFDYMLDMRTLNEGIDSRREEIFSEYLDAKYSDFKFRTLEDYERLKKVNQSRRRTQSRYVRENLMDNVRERSNGENAFAYFVDKIKENALYLLDEPENSLSAARQLELVKFLEDSARFFGCQFILSTHSPFLLAMKNAKIYDLDENPVDVKPWTELGNVRLFYEFFSRHAGEFE